MREQDALFCFLDGLCGWVKVELERHGEQDLNSTLSLPKSPTEFKREYSKGQGKKIRGNSRVGEDRDKFPEKNKSSKDKWKGKKDEVPKKYSHFLCNGPHGVFECPKRGKLAALSKTKRSNRRRGRSPHLGYSMSHKPRWKDNPVGECVWRPSSMATHYKLCWMREPTRSV